MNNQPKLKIHSPEESMKNPSSTVPNSDYVANSRKVQNTSRYGDLKLDGQRQIVELYNAKNAALTNRDFQAAQKLQEELDALKQELQKRDIPKQWREADDNHARDSRSDLLRSARDLSGTAKDEILRLGSYMKGKLVLNIPMLEGGLSGTYYLDRDYMKSQGMLSGIDMEGKPSVGKLSNLNELDIDDEVIKKIIAEIKEIESQVGTKAEEGTNPSKKEGLWSKITNAAQDYSRIFGLDGKTSDIVKNNLDRQGAEEGKKLKLETLKKKLEGQRLAKMDKLASETFSKVLEFMGKVEKSLVPGVTSGETYESAYSKPFIEEAVYPYLNNQNRYGDYTDVGPENRLTLGNLLNKAQARLQNGYSAKYN